MAERELSIIVKAKGALQAASQIGQLDGAVGRLGSTAALGARNAAGNIGKIGALTALGLGAAVKGGLDSLATLESATTSVDGAIAQMGLTGQVTSAQIAAWANEIEANVGAAFDDKDIVQATTTLIRFGKTTPSNLKPAMEVITDLATKTGDVDSAATLLAKALADPTKAAGKLARSGVILTKAEQDQIEAFEKAGDAASAQKVILDSLARTTKGAALASQGPYKKSLSELKDVTEDAERALATGFLPVIERVRDILKGALANPANIAAIKEFGQGLAGGVDQLINIAKNVPWSSIGDAMKLAGQGAKAALDIFTGLPPWVQTAVLTGWGLNKLTGGAAGSIISQLGSGLIKGVLGMTAGVVNINAGVVNGGASAAANLLPAAGGAAGAAGTAGALGFGAIAAGIVGGVVISSASLLALGKIVEATSTPAQLEANRINFNNQQVLKHTGQTLDEIKRGQGVNTSAVNATKDAIVRQKLSVAVSLTNQVYISAREVVSQTTVLKTLAGGIQQI